MTDRAISYVPADEVPAVQVAGQPGEVFGVSLSTLGSARDSAAQAYRRADELTGEPDTIESLRRDVNVLSDALAQVTAELYSLGLGIESGRITITREA